LVDIPGVNAQEESREALLESPRIYALEMLDTPFQPSSEEELVKIQVWLAAISANLTAVINQDFISCFTTDG
jgi:hypothetical protein